VFKTILFDVDGVFLSEERYFDASALTVHELLYSPQFLGLTAAAGGGHTATPDETQIRWVRDSVFVHDEILHFMKALGINSNWDMVYLQFVTQLLHLAEVSDDAALPQGRRVVQRWDGSQLQELGRQLQPVSHGVDYPCFLRRFYQVQSKDELFQSLTTWYQETFPETANVEAALHSLWEIGEQAFQEWYLGKTYLPQQTQDKAGFVHTEIPLASPEKICQLLSQCRQRGIRIGLATGRPEIETKVPFTAFGWSKFFDGRRVTTASDVLTAEKLHPQYRPLSKPHPFSYLRSYYESADTATILQRSEQPMSREAANSLLIVGDSVADFLAARAIGCHFAAVLTGLSGAAARAEFEQLGADYIWTDVLELNTLLEE